MNKERKYEFRKRIDVDDRLSGDFDSRFGGA